MELAILSDARLPTSPDFPGHGLGKMVYAVAKGLADCGHTITLLAGVGSKFDAGNLVTAANETEFLRHNLSKYDAVMDNTHQKVTTAIQGLPVIQVSHDRESRPTVNAVFASKAHRDWHGYNELDGRVIYNGVAIPAPIETTPSKPYYGYLSMFHSPKGPLMAAEAARLAGVRLVMAGLTPPAPPPGVEYVGPLMDADKLKFFAGATALLFPASTEAGPMTILEAQSVGCPVIVSAYGAARENMDDGMTGYTAHDTLEMVDAIKNISAIDRETCRRWIRENRSAPRMVDEYEKLLAEVSGGERW